MNWEEFLNHPLIIDKDREDQPGKILFLTTLHRLVSSLNGYKMWVITLSQLVMEPDTFGDNKDMFSKWDVVAEIWANSSLPGIPTDVQHWVSRWNPIVEDWLSKLMPLRERYLQEDEASTVDWADQIEKLAVIVTQAPVQYAEAQKLTLPNDEQMRSLVEGMIGSIERLVTFYRYIKGKEYIQIWTSEL